MSFSVVQVLPRSLEYEKVGMNDQTTSTIFSLEWLGIAFGLGLLIQLIGWIMGVGLLTGLPAYFVVGVLTAWGSPGNTLIEPGLAAFFIATVGFIINHLFLAVLGVGILIAVLYGVAGLALAVGGAYLGERFLD